MIQRKARRARPMLPRLCVGLLFSCGSLAAQSSVWKVTRGDQTLYVGGTCHVLRASDFPLPAEFDTAFDASATVYFETDIARVQSPEMQQVIAAHGMFSDGKSLDQVLTPAAWKKVETYFSALGMPSEQVRMFKPWMIVILVTATELQKIGVSMEGVDMHYFKRAKAEHKKIGELETFEQQVEFLVQLGAGHESELIANTLEELGDLPKQLDEMLAAWKTGDLAAIDTLMIEDVRKRYPAIYQDLFVERNNAWLAKLDALLKSPEVELALVGAGHLPGKDGLLDQLRARGCRVEQLNAPASSRP